MSSSAALLTAAEVARFTQVSVQTVYRWAGANPPILRSVRIGDGVIRFRPEDVEAMLEAALAPASTDEQASA